MRPRLAPLRRGIVCFANYGCVPGLYPDETFLVTAFIRTDTPSGRSVPLAQQRLRTLLPGRYV
jgi:hypothetical protein